MAIKPRPSPGLFCAALLLVLSRLAPAQELKQQPIPFTAYLDFASLTASASGQRSFPIWLESFEVHAEKNDSGNIEKTTYRLRFRKFAGLNDEMLLRLYFDDTQRPLVSAWSEIGTRALEPRQLGQGLGLPNSETLMLPMANIDYVDIDVPGNGSNVHAAFLTSLRKVESRTALDFETPAAWQDPFDKPAAAMPNPDDTALWGRVKATLESGTVTLSEANAGTTILDFDLATQPQLALVTFEILNANVSAPPRLFANGHEIGDASLILPDLADPAFRVGVQPMRADLTFHYGGWLKCQKIIPGSELRAGANSFTISTAPHTDAVAIRAIEMQLKYDLP